MTSSSQPAAPAAVPHSGTHHGHGIAALLLSAAGLLIAARRLRRLRRLTRFFRRHDKRGMPLTLFLFLLLLGVPLVIGGVLVLFGVPILTSILIGIGGLVLLIILLLGGLYFFGGEKE